MASPTGVLVMARLSSAAIIELCQTAADLDFGLLLQTDNVDYLRTDIFTRLKEAGYSISDFDLSVCTPSTPNTLYLLKKSVELPE